MAATTKVTVDTTAGGTELCSARPDRVSLTLYNKGAVEVMIKPVIPGETLSANLYAFPLAATTGKVNLTDNDAKYAYRGLTASGSSDVMVSQTFNNDRGV